MTYTVVGGETRMKVDLDKITDEMLEELAAIEQADFTQSVKTKRFKRLATKVKARLYNDKRKNEESKIRLSTYKRYLVHLRKEIKRAGYKHHSLSDTIARKDTLARLLKTYPQYRETFEPLSHEPALTVTKLRNDILRQLMRDKKNKVKGAANAYNDLKRIKLHHEVTAHLLLDDVQADEMAEAGNEALAEKVNNPVVIPAQLVQSIIEQALASHAYSHQAVGLALCCGRREVELMYSGSFEYVSEYRVKFRGQAKKQEGIKWGGYEIPVLIPANDFITAFDNFRKHPSVMATHEAVEGMNKDARNSAINKRVAKTLNTAVKRFFDDDERTFKDCRAIYTSICVERFWNKEDQTEGLFVKGLLGHAESDYKSAWHYRHFVISDDATPPAPSENKESEKPIADVSEEEAPPMNTFVGAPMSDDPDMKPLSRAISNYTEANPKRRVIERYHHKVREWAAYNPDRAITKTSLFHRGRGGVGGGRNTVDEYLSVLNAAGVLEKYNKARY